MSLCQGLGMFDLVELLGWGGVGWGCFGSSLEWFGSWSVNGFYRANIVAAIEYKSNFKALKLVLLIRPPSREMGGSH